MFSLLPYHFAKAWSQKLVSPHLYNLSLKICRSISSENSTSTNSGKEDYHTCTDSSSSSSSSSSSLSSLLQINEEELHMKVCLRKELIPKHIAVILDGIGDGLKHRENPLIMCPSFKNVPYLLTFVSNMELPLLPSSHILTTTCNEAKKEIRMRVIGARTECTKSLQDVIKQVEEATSRLAKPQLELRLALCYAGTRDILEATRRLCEKAKAGAIEPSDIDMATFDRELEAGGAPTPELLIRVGGELRLSNFLVWHLAVAEYYFNPVKAPDFTEDHFVDALRTFQQRDRSFGK